MGQKIRLSLWVVVMVFTLPFSTVMAAGVSGVIKFEGTPPQMNPINMAADPVCHKAHSKPVLAETLVLGPGQTMANIFVRVKKGLPSGKTYPVPTKPVVVSQKGCQYNPHVIGVMAGQGINFMNPDGILHNVHAFPKINRPFNLAMPPAIKEKEKKFRKSETMFPVKCDVHPWMQSWVGVMDHPFFSVTGKDGKYKIDGLDAGTYEIEAWHEKLGTMTQSITLGASDQKSLNFAFSRESKQVSQN